MTDLTMTIPLYVNMSITLSPGSKGNQETGHFRPSIINVFNISLDIMLCIAVWESLRGQNWIHYASKMCIVIDIQLNS